MVSAVTVLEIQPVFAEACGVVSTLRSMTSAAATAAVFAAACASVAASVDADLVGLVGSAAVSVAFAVSVIAAEEYVAVKPASATAAFHSSAAAA